jgi:hypothetical protein
VLAVADVLAARAGGLLLRSSSAMGMVAAAFLLFGGAVRVGSSGPLLHMANLRDEWGESAYVAAQVASQAVVIGGTLALCGWAVGLSVHGFRARVLPVALCALAILPAYRIVAAVLGPLGVLGDADILWLLGIASILGTILWCLGLGVVLLWRGGRVRGGDPTTSVVDA